MIEWLYDVLLCSYSDTVKRHGVVDEAIDLLEYNHTKDGKGNYMGGFFMCNRLDNANIKLGHDHVHYVGIRNEFKKFARELNGGKLPSWWSLEPYEHFTERYTLLVAYRARLQRRMNRCYTWRLGAHPAC